MKVKLVNKITKKTSPYKNKILLNAHRIADKTEKKSNPREYKEMKKVDNKLGKHEYVDKTLKSGTIEISKKVPPRDRKGVLLHAKTEDKKMAQARQRKKK